MNWLTDCLIRIKNASAIHKPFVTVRGTKISLKVLEVLKAEGFILDYGLRDDASFKQACNVTLKYYKGHPLVKKMAFVSTPKNRIHKKCSDLKRYMDRFRFAVVSTNRGVMAVKDAIENNLGGEVLFWMEN